MRGRSDSGRARSVFITAALPQASPYAGRRWPLRRIFRQELATADLPDGEEHYPSKRLTRLRSALSPERSEDRAHPLGAQVFRWARVALVGEPGFTIDHSRSDDLRRAVVEAAFFAAASCLIGLDHDGRNAVSSFTAARLDDEGATLGTAFWA